MQTASACGAVVYIYDVLCRRDSLSSAIPEGMQYIEPLTENDETLEVHQVGSLFYWILYVILLINVLI